MEPWFLHYPLLMSGDSSLGQERWTCQFSDKEPTGSLVVKKFKEQNKDRSTHIKVALGRPIQHLMSESNKKRICCPHWMSISARGWIHRVQRHGQKCCTIWLQGICQTWDQLNAREGVREEKWVSFDLRTVKFPSTQTSSVRRATLIQNFEADFIRAMGIISSSAALYAQAVIAGVQQDLPIYRRTRCRDHCQGLDDKVAGRAVAQPG